MTTNSSSLDLTRLEKVRHCEGKTTARCPACAESGGDRRGNHLTIFPSGKFGCAAMQGDADHRRQIFAHAGIPDARERDADQDRVWRQQRATERREAQERQRLLATILEKRAKIIVRHPWAPADVWDDSPQRIDCDLVEFDPRHFLATLFPQDAIVWSGDVRHSGTRHADHWRSVAAWQDESALGPFTTPAVWKPGTCSRTAANVHAAPYVVLDFDGFDGRKPEKPDEIEKHRLDSLSLVRWLREGLHWQLAAIVWTGSKSIHAWFHTPPPAVLQSLRNTSAALGIDTGLIGRPEHPCRLPGHRHQKTGGMSCVLWLKEPMV
jgi:hypothetical protein